MKGLAGQQREAEARLAAASRRQLELAEAALRGLVMADSGSATQLRQALQRLAGWAAWLPGEGAWVRLLQRDCRPWSARRPERAVTALRAFYEHSGLLLDDSREALRQALLSRLRGTDSAAPECGPPFSAQAGLRIAAALGLLPAVSAGEAGTEQGWLLVLASGAAPACVNGGNLHALDSAATVGQGIGGQLRGNSLPAVSDSAGGLVVWRQEYLHHCADEALRDGLEYLSAGILRALLELPSPVAQVPDGGAEEIPDAARHASSLEAMPNSAGPFPWERFARLQALLRVAGLEAAVEAALALQVRLCRELDPHSDNGGAAGMQAGLQALLHELSRLLTAPETVAVPPKAAQYPPPCQGDPQLAAALRAEVAGLLKSLDDAGRREEALRWHPSQPLLTALYRCGLAAAEFDWEDLRLPLTLARDLLLACRQERRELAAPLWRGLRALALRLADRAGPCRHDQRRALLLIELALRREWLELQRRRAGRVVVLHGAEPQRVPLQQLPQVLARSLRLLGVPPLPSLQSAAGLATLRESLLGELRLLEQGAAGLGVHRLEALAAALLELHEELKAQPLPHPAGLLAQAHRRLAALLHQAAAWQEVERAHETVCALYNWLEERPDDAPALLSDRGLSLYDELERLREEIRYARVTGVDGEDLGPHMLEALARLQSLSPGAGPAYPAVAESSPRPQTPPPGLLPFGSLRQNLRRFLARLGSALEFSLHLELRDPDLLCPRRNLEQARPVLETLLRQLFLESLQSGASRPSAGPRMRRVTLRAALLPTGLQITLTEPASTANGPRSSALKSLRRRLRPAQLRLELSSEARHYHLLLSDPQPQP